MKLITLFTAGLVFFGEAQANQTSHTLTEGETEWAFEFGWDDGRGKSHTINFSLPAERISADLAVPLQFQKREANKEIMAAINKYGDDKSGVNIQVEEDDSGTVQISGSGETAKLKKAVKGIKKVQNAALKKYMKQHGFTKLRGKIIPNHAQHAYRYGDDLVPLADALGAKTLKRRGYAKRALSFVQTIPYEKGRGGRDKGFRLPMSLLAKNRGDCDSKATLYLALLKAAHPSLDSAFIYINGHAFVGLGLKPREGDMTFKADGRTWVIAEPVGPALAPLGDADKKSKEKARKGKIKIRRVKDD
jgi:hypothetical protein